MTSLLVPLPKGRTEDFGLAGKDRVLVLAEALKLTGDKAAGRAMFRRAGYKTGAVREWREGRVQIIVQVFHTGGPVQATGLVREQVKSWDGQGKSLHSSGEVAGIDGSRYVAIKRVNGKGVTIAIGFAASNDLVVNVAVLGTKDAAVAKVRMMQLLKAQYARLP